MAALYKVPLEVEQNELCHFDIAERHNVYIEASHDPKKVWVIGIQDHLASFFQELDGPGQSFPITEFVEYIQDYKLGAQ